METVQKKSARWPKDCCKTQKGKLCPFEKTQCDEICLTCFSPGTHLLLIHRILFP